jgi:ferredoxin
MPARVTIDPDLCIGSAECNRLVPEGFVLDETLGVSVPLPGAGMIDRERLYGAEAGCPTGAIMIETDDDAAVAG